MNEEKNKTEKREEPRREMRRPRGQGRREDRNELAQKVIDTRRVTRVVSGGRRFSFSIAVIVGDKNGSVGLGTGKAGDATLAIQKAARHAKKNLFLVPATKDKSIPHDVTAKFSSCRVKLMPNRGRGIVAGSSVRDILNLAGLKNITAKILSGSKNRLNIAEAAVKALRSFRAINKPSNK
jgi:small subunit ribosomal protein S5